jgi:hypothetical protein
MTGRDIRLIYTRSRIRALTYINAARIEIVAVKALQVSIAVVALICDAQAQIVFTKSGNEFMCLYRGSLRTPTPR